jgi:hypothetical protein
VRFSKPSSPAFQVLVRIIKLYDSMLSVHGEPEAILTVLKERVNDVHRVCGIIYMPFNRTLGVDPAFSE